MYSDVPQDFYAKSYIEWATRLGIVQGYQGNIFIPQPKQWKDDAWRGEHIGLVTRAEAATMCVRTFGLSCAAAAAIAAGIFILGDFLKTRKK